MMGFQFKDNITLNVIVAVLSYIYLSLGILYHHVLVVMSFWSKKQRLPPIKNEILLKSATELSEDIRTRKITSEKVVRAYIDRIREVNPFINAIVHERFEMAIEDAKKVDSLIDVKAKSQDQLSKKFPLLGVPFTVKGLLEVKGMPCTAGCLYHRDRIASQDAQVVALMKKAGAICLATTNTPEFGSGLDTANLLYGRTNNPYNTRKTCGGSSGGEAALVASAGSLIGIANDLLGSIRIPAFYTGTFAHKPSQGLVPNTGMFPPLLNEFSEFLCSGLLCRYAEDLSTVVKILSGSSSIANKIGHKVNFSRFRILYMIHDGGNPFTLAVEEDLIAAIRKVAYHFQQEFDAKVAEVNIESMKYAFKIWIHCIAIPFFENATEIYLTEMSKLNPPKELLNLMLLRPQFSASAVMLMNFEILCPLLKIFTKEVEENYQYLNDELNDIFDGNTLLLLPTFPKKASNHKEGFLLAGSMTYTAIINVFGLPSTQCPVGLSKNGLPLGLQVVSGRGDDYLTLACAKEIERVFGGWTQPS